MNINTTKPPFNVNNNIMIYEKDRFRTTLLIIVF